jgi:DNA-binding beta-propeller fold protein YncE
MTTWQVIGLLPICAVALGAADPLPTGVRLDPEGAVVDLGSMPMGMVLAPGGKKLIVVLSGWREQGIQVVDLVSMRVVQTLAQPAAFYGAAFSSDGKTLYVSGGNDDAIYAYEWDGELAVSRTRIELGRQKQDQTGSRYPAGIAAARRGKFIYVAENVGDSLAVVDTGTQQIVQRLPTDHYPYAVEVARDGRVYVSAWGGDTISIFRPRRDGTLVPNGRLRVGRHPSALCAAGTLLYVALAGSDRIAVVDTDARRVVRFLSDAAPAGPGEGSTPNALSSDGPKLFVAEADNNAIAVFDLAAGGRTPIARIPTDWYPTAVVAGGGRLIVLSGKGRGTRPNPDGPVPGQGIQCPLGYALGQLNGTLRVLPASFRATELRALSRRVALANGWKKRARRRYPPFKHVVYIIKENRTYDQVFGDLEEGDGDPRLLFFGADSTPNHRALAKRFGLFDRFFTNAEVSSQGHLWSTAAYVTDYAEKTVPSLYSSRRGDVDGDDAAEPERGFLWTLAAQQGITFRDYGEMVHGPQGWPVTQRDLGADVSPSYPPFNLEIPDQKRADAWIAELKQFTADGEMPQLEVLHLPGDHTAGANPKYRTPRAYMADNDLALGRIIEALSHSPFWRDTVVFVLEDDAQAGPDHVDSHRSPLLVISAWNRPGTIHRFANTTDVVAAIEDILGLGSLAKFDYFSRPLSDVFASAPDLTPYTALVPSANMEEMNPPKTAAATMSEGIDLARPDHVDDALFNRILWAALKGEEPMPRPVAHGPLHMLQMSR